MELDGRLSRTNWIRTGIAQLTLRLAAFFVCTGVFLAAGAGARAAEVSEEEKPGDFVTNRVEAQLEKTDREALLDRINAIRREACEEGVNNPVNGIPLTPADYVPLRWSGELEKIAELRAVESTIIQDHIRPDGTECFTAAPEGISYTMETLAWGFDSAADAVEGWYSEKSSYVETDGKPAGHYMALINPENRFVGIAGLSAQWQRNACAGAFGGESAAAQEKAAAAGGNGTDAEIPEKTGNETVWMISLRRDLLPTAVGRAVEVTAGRIFRAASF